MATRYDKTLADYLVIAVSPALIMTLVGSLVYFLLELFYQGNFTGRLHYILSLFIFAAVLVGRIAIEDGKERAALFALPLAGATMLAIVRFVEFQGPLGQASFIINFGLVALIWWCAHKLTWDCTMIDETEPGSGEGLLDAAGLGEKTSRVAGVPPAPDADGTVAPRDKPHAPGVWIVYFSLAALPLFGLGQLAIPVYQAGRRRYAFFLLAVYVASGLGLLLTTSFLGLRRYLRQRRLPMPMLMTSTWIALGCALIFGVMGLALLLPRPNAELAISQFPRLMGSPDQNPSKHGMGNDGVRGNQPGRPEPGEKGTPAPGQSDKTQPGGKQGDKPGSGKPEGGKQEPGKQEGSKQDTGKEEGQRPDNNKPAGDKSKSDKASKPDPDEKSRQQPSNDAGDRSAHDGAKHNESRARPSADGPRGDRPQDSKNDRDQSKSEKQPENRPGEEPSRAEPGNRPPDTPPPPDITSTFDWLLPLVKVLFYLVIAGLVVFWAWRHRAGIIASLHDLLNGLRGLWNRLFAGLRKAETAASPENVPRPRQFADFVDPFTAGMASQLPADQLVRYLFAVLEAWGHEHGCPREPEQTPHEFARAVAEREHSLLPGATCLADLYCEAAYAPGQLKSVNMKPLQELWHGLHAQSTADRDVQLAAP